MSYTKFLFLIAGISLFIFGCNNQPKKYSKEAMYVYEYEDDKLTDNYLYREKEFDSKGNIIKNIDYNKDGTIDKTETYNYDNNDNEILYSRIGNDHVEFRKVYDKKNNMVKNILSRNDMLESIDSIVYRDTLKLEWWTTTLESKEFTIGRDKPFIGGNKYDYKLFRTYIYDSNGNLIKTYNRNLTETNFIVEYKYDKNGNNIEERQSSPDIKLTEYTMQIFRTFDSNNNLIDDIGFMGKYVQYHFKYFYDENNRKVKQQCIERDPNEIIYEYTSVQNKF